jgi:hypothetical protein
MFLLGFLLITVLSVLQHQQRALLHKTEAPTAVGDHDFFALAQPIVWHRSVGSLAETPLYLVSDQAVERDDIQMRKVAWWRRYHIYQDMTASQAAYFLKIRRGHYLPLGTERRPDAPN